MSGSDFPPYHLPDLIRKEPDPDPTQLLTMFLNEKCHFMYLTAVSSIVAAEKVIKNPEEWGLTEDEVNALVDLYAEATDYLEQKEITDESF